MAACHKFIWLFWSIIILRSRCVDLEQKPRVNEVRNGSAMGYTGAIRISSSSISDLHPWFMRLVTPILCCAPVNEGCWSQVSVWNRKTSLWIFINSSNDRVHLADSATNRKLSFTCKRNKAFDCCKPLGNLRVTVYAAFVYVADWLRSPACLSPRGPGFQRQGRQGQLSHIRKSVPASAVE